MNPMTAVRSPGRTTTERKAALGAMSIEARDDRRMRKKREPAREDGTGMSARAIADGRCVKTMVRMRPMRLERDDATSEEIAERIPITKKIVPREPSSSPNFP